jgi:uncharacterized protein YbjT (DUF2867 family)
MVLPQQSEKTGVVEMNPSHSLQLPDVMKILLTGATGYIGKRLLPVLVKNGYTVVCCVRDQKRFNPPESMRPFLEIVEADLLDRDSLKKIPADIKAAYYLVHSMSSSRDYVSLEKQSAANFREAMDRTEVEQVIYLGGITNEDALSTHLQSRKNVEQELSNGNFHLTTLRAGIVIGSGSASFEIIRDLVEKLPVMVTPKWLETRCQPIGVSDVIQFLSGVLFRKETYDQDYDIAGPDVLSYKEMLLGFAEARGLKRSIWIVPVMTPRLSSYWLYFVTSTSYFLAVALVKSMKVEVVARDNRLSKILGIEPIGYQEALQKAFARIQSHEIVSSWKDSVVSGAFQFNVSEFLDVPSHGCFIDCRKGKMNDREEALEKVWRIGGNNGWYYATWLWRLRGFIDKLFGGVGLRRGRTDESKLRVGDAVDFWRVLYANKEQGRLLLFAEMKLPGEAWLEFQTKGAEMIQTATFRPRGLLGRLYWYLVLPFHGFIFDGMLRKIAGGSAEKFS